MSGSGSAKVLCSLREYQYNKSISLDGCPMDYTSPNAPKVVDVLGTWLLSILDGQQRYAHVAGLRGDEVAPRYSA
ncbi:hypothetical protein [Nitrosomonas sp.]|uniref:hypothetical protein n=1 Tax=Nitrosomonas sp. TaxID=42353 RepID=UPI0025EDF07F|nr:hypothetical protein [Nitrosomonas sp.]